jgi:hypothetical protein
MTGTRRVHPLTARAGRLPAGGASRGEQYSRNRLCYAAMRLSAAARRLL